MQRLVFKRFWIINGLAKYLWTSVEPVEKTPAPVLCLCESVRRHRHMLCRSCLSGFWKSARIQTGYRGGCQCFVLDETSLVKGKLCTIMEQGGCSSDVLDQKNWYYTPKGFIFNICPISKQKE